MQEAEERPSFCVECVEECAIGDVMDTVEIDEGTEISNVWIARQKRQ